MSEILILYQANDTIIEVAGLKNEVTGAFVNNATVNVTLLDSVGALVTGQTFPLTLAYVAVSDAVYRAKLNFGLVLTPNGKYSANVNVLADGLVANWSIDVICKKRK